MPQIPIVNEAQAMNVSSPVAIGNVDTSMQSAIGKFGQVLEDLSNKMEETQIQQRQKIKGNEADVALADYWQSQNDAANSEALTEEGKPRTAKEATNYLVTRGKELQEEMIKNLGMDPVSASAFRAKARATDNHFTPGLMKQSAELTSKFEQTTKQTNLMKLGSIISQDQSMLAETLVGIEEKVLGDPAILNKPEALARDKGVLFESAIGAAMRDNKFNVAKTLLEQGIQSGAYTPESAERRFNAIRTTQQSVSAETRQAIATRRAVEAEQEKAQTEEVYAELSVKLERAGSDPAALDVLAAEMQTNSMLSRKEKINVLATIKKATGVDVASVRRTNSLVSSVLTGDVSYESAIKQTRESSDLSAQQKASLLRTIRAAETFKTSNPGGHSIAQSYSKQLDLSFTPDRMKPGASIDSTDSLAMKSAAQRAFWSEVYKKQLDGQINPSDYELIYSKVKVTAGKSAGSPPALPPGASVDNFKDVSSASSYIKSLAEREKTNPPKNRAEAQQRIMQKLRSEQWLEILRLREQAQQLPATAEKKAAPKGRKAFDD